MRNATVVSCARTFALMLIIAAPVGAQDLEWDGDCGTQLWQSTCSGGTMTNWDPESLPDSTTDVTIPARFGEVQILLIGVEAASISALGGLVVDSAGLTVTGESDVFSLTLDAAPFPSEIVSAGVFHIDGLSTFNRGTLRGGGQFLHEGEGSGTHIKLTSAEFDNFGELTLNEGFELRDDAVLMNNGDLDLTGAFGIDTLAGAATVLQQAGRLRQTGTTNTLAITSDYFQTGGTLAADGGVMQLLGEWSIQGGTLEAATNSAVELRGTTGSRVIADASITGSGEVLFQYSGLVVEGAVSANMIDDGGDGLRLQNTVQIDGTLTNTGYASTGGVVLTGDGTFQNDGTFNVDMTQVDCRMAMFRNGGTFSQNALVRIGTGSLVNEAGGTYRWNESNIVPSPVGEPGRLRNEGTLLFTQGKEGAVQGIQVPFDMVPNSKFDLHHSIGPLPASVVLMNGGGVWSGGEIEMVVGDGDRELSLRLLGDRDVNFLVDGDVDVTGDTRTCFDIGEDGVDALELRIDGTLTLAIGAGNENDDVGGGRFRHGTISGSGELVNTGTFVWDGGIFSMSDAEGHGVRNEGFFKIASGGVGNQSLGGRLVNNGVVVQSAEVFVSLGRIDNTNCWRMTKGSGVSTALPGQMFRNSGEFVSDTMTAAEVSRIEVDFDNTGIVWASTGVIEFAGTVEQFDADAGVLTGGIWIADTGGKIVFPGALRTLYGPVELVGGSETIPDLDELETLDNGAKVQANGLATTGPLQVRGGSELTTEGQNSFPLLFLEGGSSAVLLPDSVVDALVELHNGGVDSTADEVIGFVQLSAVGGAPPKIITPSFLNHAVIVPGGYEATGRIDLEGDLVQMSTGVLHCELQGTSIDDVDLFTVDGTASLDGTLRVLTINDFEPELGDSFVVLTSTNALLGAFEALDLPALGDGLAWQVNDDFGAFTLTVAETSPDINGDGTVDVTDLLLVLGAWGPCDGACPEDVNADGIVDVTDLLAVLGAWGPVR